MSNMCVIVQSILPIQWVTLKINICYSVINALSISYLNKYIYLFQKVNQN